MSGPHGRRGLALLLVIAAALAVGSDSPAADRTAKSGSACRAGPGRSAGSLAGADEGNPAARRVPGGRWGGAYTVKSGMRVTVFSSRSYPVDKAVNQAAADFVDSLVHGTEIGTVSRSIFAPPAEVAILCESADVDGCYFPKTSEIVTIGEDTPWSTVEEVLAHEYGHHVANNRDNYPWPAIAYGTKRWATYKGICAKEAAGAGVPRRRGRALPPEPRRGFRRVVPASERGEARHAGDARGSTIPRWRRTPARSPRSSRTWSSPGKTT